MAAPPRTSPPPTSRFRVAALLLALTAGCAGPARKHAEGSPPSVVASAPGAPRSRGGEREAFGALAAIVPSASSASAAPALLAERPADPPASAPPAVHPFHAPLPDPSAFAEAPATRYARLSPKSCRAELSRRGIASGKAGRAAPGVATPVRIAGPLRGVRLVAPGGKSPYGVLDCRLLLALDDMTERLARHGVVGARIDNLYRPRARLAGRRKPSQHAHGLALDLTAFELEDGRTLSVERDWRGALGEPACGPESRPVDPTEETFALRNIVCDLFGAGIFHHVLTPNYDAAHRDHLHLDLKRKADRLVLR